MIAKIVPPCRYNFRPVYIILRDIPQGARWSVITCSLKTAAATLSVITTDKGAWIYRSGNSSRNLQPIYVILFPKFVYYTVTDKSSSIRDYTPGGGDVY